MNGIKIISDGTGCGTKVLTKDGVDISSSITSIQISIKPDSAVLAELTFVTSDVEIEAVTTDLGGGIELTNLDGSKGMINCD